MGPGDYIAALDDLPGGAEGIPSKSDLEAIALQTGELFQTTELTTDGDAPQFLRQPVYRV